MKHFCIVLLSFLCSFSMYAQRAQNMPMSDEYTRKGKDLFEQKKFGEAYRIFSEALTEADKDLSIKKDELALYKTFCAYELRLPDAEGQIKNYLKEYPYTPYGSELHYMAGMLLTENERYKQALKEFDQVNERYLSKRQADDYLFYKAYAQMKEGETAAATQTFKKVMDRKTRYQVAAQFYYAYGLYTMKDYEKALPYFLQLEGNPDYANNVPYYIVQIYYYLNNYDEVVDRATELLKSNNKENQTELHRMLGELYYERQNYGMAAQHLKAYTEKEKKLQRNDLYMLGFSYYQQGQYKEAIQYLTQTTTTEDLMTENAYLHIGNAYVKLGDKNNARLAFSNAVNTNFDAQIHEEAMFNYALTTYESDDTFGESVNAFVNFITQYPNSKHISEAYRLFGDVLLRTNNYKEAYDALLMVNADDQRLTATKHYLLYRMGVMFCNAKRWGEAVQYFNDAIACDETGAYVGDCLYWRAECFYKSGQYALAEADLKVLFGRSDINQNPNKALAYYLAGYACFAQHKYKDAIPYFLSYTAIEKDKMKEMHSDALNRIGDCYFQGRDFGPAENYYARVIGIGRQGADYAYFQRANIMGLLKKYDDKILLEEKLVKQYPKSDYADDALYEMARAYQMKEEYPSAIDSYNRLLASYPHSNLARVTAVEIGMTYANMGQQENAITAYKKVISNYPGSEESYTALQGIESAYIALNQISEYLAYTKTLGTVITVPSENKEDSLTYVAAELQYTQGNLKAAIIGMEGYIQNYCPVGRYCTMAWYYLADSQYQLDNKKEALKAYDALTKMANNQYTEEAYTKCAELAYDLQMYDSARVYFSQLQTVAGKIELVHAARIGVMRCDNKLERYQDVITQANEIVKDGQTNEEMQKEARYTRAKAYMALEQPMLATADLTYLSSQTNDEMGAEAKYLLALLYFDQGDLDTAESEIMDFASKNTPHQYWLAKSFILLADIYMKRGDDFQAKQYLLSLSNNYKGNDDVDDLIKERLALIAERESERVVTE